MNFKQHPETRIQKLKIGKEKLPLLVIDNLLSQPDYLVELACKTNFSVNSPYYPGVRADAPSQYKQFILEELAETLIEFFKLKTSQLTFSFCQFSMVTTSPNDLHLLQRIPHFDSLDKNGLAAVHYLFKTDLGGTSFYRHRDTQFESIDDERRAAYFDSMKKNGSNNLPPAEYINGDTALYERIAEQQGIYNRIIIYPRNILHSGSIPKDFIPDHSPLTGRLSINSFIDPIN
jgi:Family of unknown function (DUF6445)